MEFDALAMAQEIEEISSEVMGGGNHSFDHDAS